ncbi:MAG TPA: ABC transporter substrate-binding protein [Clostridia bacterium]|nr:ABC transporter substrate-binding protein [Clostridia bacterium]
MERKVSRFAALLIVMIMLVSWAVGCVAPKTPNGHGDEDREDAIGQEDTDGINDEGEDKADANGEDEPEDDLTQDQEGLFPLEVVDSLGRSITIEKMPEKVISLAPNATETLFALGIGDRVIGVSQQCDYPEEAQTKDKMGDFWEPNIELIVEANPDILFVGNAAPEEFLDKMDESGITVLALEGFDLEGTYGSIIDTGRAMGASQEAETLVKSMKDKAADIRQKVDSAEEPQVYFVISYGEYGDFTAGGKSFIDELITMAGGKNIAGDTEEEWPQYSMEKLVEKDPEIVFSTMQAQPDGIADTPGYKELTAIKEGRLIVLDDNLINRAGPRLIEGLEDLAKGMHPDLFD